MWPFRSRERQTLSHAVLAGRLRDVRKMLDRGADPNLCDPGDTAYPIHYAVNLGPAMVQLLVDHGADVNMPGRGNATPLAKAESRGFTEVASVLRKAGARLRTDNDDYSMDPRFRLQLESNIATFLTMARIQFPTEGPESIADRVEEKLKFEFPEDMPKQLQEEVRREARALIVKHVG